MHSTRSAQDAAPQATVAEELQALKLPEYAGSGMTTHHLEAAVRDIRHAEEASRPTDRAVFAARADQHLLFARRSVESTIAAWREYNARADRLIAKLDDVERVDGSGN